MTHQQQPFFSSDASQANASHEAHRGENIFQDLFKPLSSAPGPHDVSNYGRGFQSQFGAQESARSHLPNLSIGGDTHAHHPGSTAPHLPEHHANHIAGQGVEHRVNHVAGQPGEQHVARSAPATDAHPAHRRGHTDATASHDAPLDTGMGSWKHDGSSSQAIAQAAADSVGHHTYVPRPGSQYYGQHLSANLGCTSASTNMFFDGLKAAGKVSDADYRKINQIGNDSAYVNMQHLGIAAPVKGSELKPGDWAYFKNPGAKHGHSGVVFQGKDGEMMVANNHSATGTTVATPLSTMMHRYSSVRGLRAKI